ncbi:hypothetical protein P8452_28697 [Trifolium repens]|nr:hypothetical protein P8452_28697 [Trifolium repens]
MDDVAGISCGRSCRKRNERRSRVVQTTDPERNYHCFYQLCASERDVEKYKFGHPSHFHYLNQSKVYELDGVSSTEEYIKTRRTMNIVGISHEDQEAIFRTLAAILHLGNVEFSPGKEHDSSIIKDEKSTFHLQMAANLFKCDLNLLRATLCTRTIQIREGNIVKAFDCNAAVAGRDVLAKTVYARLFDWFFDKINKTVGQDINSRMQIGILDIMALSLLRITVLSNSASILQTKSFNNILMRYEIMLCMLIALTKLVPWCFDLDLDIAFTPSSYSFFRLL